jgi:hypothetical protein
VIAAEINPMDLAIHRLQNFYSPVGADLMDLEVAMTAQRYDHGLNIVKRGSGLIKAIPSLPIQPWSLQSHEAGEELLNHDENQIRLNLDFSNRMLHRFPQPQFVEDLASVYLGNPSSEMSHFAAASQRWSVHHTSDCLQDDDDNLSPLDCQELFDGFDIASYWNPWNVARAKAALLNYQPCGLFVATEWEAAFSQIRSVVITSFLNDPHSGQTIYIGLESGCAQPRWWSEQSLTIATRAAWNGPFFEQSPFGGNGGTWMLVGASTKTRN